MFLKSSQYDDQSISGNLHYKRRKLYLDTLNVSKYFSGMYFKMFEIHVKLSVSRNSPSSLKQTEHLFPDALNK